MSTDTFALDIDKFVAKTKANIEIAIKKIALDLFRRIVLRTPVDTGRLRGNWQLTIGELSFSFDDYKFDKGGSATIQEAAAILSGAREVSRQGIWLANHLPYAEVIEYGSSNQAPEGMVRIAAAEIAGELGLGFDLGSGELS